MEIFKTAVFNPAKDKLHPPLLLIGSWGNIAWTAVTALIGVICLASSLHGYLLLPIKLLLRFVLFISAIALIAPGLESDLVGLLLVGALLLQQKLSNQT